MKSTFIFLLLASILFSACNKKQPPAPQPKETESSSQQANTPRGDMPEETQWALDFAIPFFCKDVGNSSGFSNVQAPDLNGEFSERFVNWIETHKYTGFQSSMANIESSLDGATQKMALYHLRSDS